MVDWLNHLVIRVIKVIRVIAVIKEVIVLSRFSQRVPEPVEGQRSHFGII